MLLIYKTNLTDNQPTSTHFLKMSTDSEDFMFSGINSQIFMKDFETFIWILPCFSLFVRLICFIESEFIEGQAFPFHRLIYCVSMGSTFAKFSNPLLREGGWRKKGKGEGVLLCFHHGFDSQNVKFIDYISINSE